MEYRSLVIKNRTSFFLSGLLGLLTLFLLLAILPSVNPVLTKSETTSVDEEAIREILNNRNPVEFEAREAFDPSLLESIYTNEPGPGCTAPLLEVVQFIRQDDTLKADQVGLLDAMQAYVLWQKQAYEKVHIIEARMIAEGRTTMTQEEKDSLHDETGLNYPDPYIPPSYPPPSHQSPYPSTPFTGPMEAIESITFVNPARATAIVLFIETTRKTEYTLVKLGDSWRISCAQPIHRP